MEEIVGILEGSNTILDCHETGECERSGACVTQNVWRKLDSSIKSTLRAIKLSDLVDDYRKTCFQPNFEI